MCDQGTRQGLRLLRHIGLQGQQRSFSPSALPYRNSGWQAEQACQLEAFHCFWGIPCSSIACNPESTRQQEETHPRWDHGTVMQWPFGTTSEEKCAVPSGGQNASAAPRHTTDVAPVSRSCTLAVL